MDHGTRLSLLLKYSVHFLLFVLTSLIEKNGYVVYLDI